MYTAEHVWALAVAADRINEGYIKADEWTVTGQDTSELHKTANKNLVKQWLRDGTCPMLPEDIEKGKEVRHYFAGFLFRQIAGQCNDFEAQALRIAQIEEFTGKHLLEFAVISCLPSVMIRDRDKVHLTREINSSTQLPHRVGEQVIADIEVIKKYYNTDYAKWVITAKLVDSYVSFYYTSDLEVGSVVHIKGKVKEHRDNNTTRLHYVKVIG